jgi:23S rRNA U2552 (ribose-2'-O)-methylase RlmE/FtsJ
VLAPGGSAVIKLVRGADTALAAQARRQFGHARLFRPEATHRESSEIYLIGTGYTPTSADQGPEAVDA